MHPCLRGAGALLLVSPSALAGPQRPSELPLSIERWEPAQGVLELALVESALEPLAAQSRARFLAVPLPDGRAVDLELARLDPGGLIGEVRIDERAASLAERAPGLSVWAGRAGGETGAETMLAFSRFGAWGWIRSGGELHHLVSTPKLGEHGERDWSGVRVRVVSEAQLTAMGAAPAATCVAPPAAQPAGGKAPATPQGPGSIALSKSLFECAVSVETDYQLFTVFGNAGAQLSYLSSLLTWASYRYEEQVQTRLVYPYLQIYTNPGDPWTTPDVGGNCIDMLYEFQAAWQNAIPAGGKLGAFLSGANLGCGVAWLPGLCNPPYDFSVSGNINGGVSFPLQVSPANWDFMVVCHEIGHNFGAPHTHDYCPPLDECPPPAYFGGCQTQQVCTSAGTIMSYCHLCSGGLANITTYFHLQSAADMRAYVEGSCLPLACFDPLVYCTAKVNSLGCTPAIDASGHPTLSGLDDFQVFASGLINQKTGLHFFGSFPAATPFQGGFLCVQMPIQRTPAQSTGGNPPPDDCSGTLSFHWSHAFLQAQGFGAGTTLFTQFWYRDPSSPSATGLTNALSFDLCN